MQVGGTFVVEGGIDEIQESIGVIFSFGGPRMVDPDGRWMIVDGGLGGDRLVDWMYRSM